MFVYKQTGTTEYVKKKNFTSSRVNYSRILGIQDAKFSGYCFRSWVIVPLKFTLISFFILIFCFENTNQRRVFMAGA